MKQQAMVAVLGTLVVNDLKMGPDARGAVALWIDGSTLAHFRNLDITTDN
jgi:hypothetical protein